MLAAALSDRFDIVVAAPAEDMSGSGTGIGRFNPDKGVPMEKVSIREAPTAYAIEGPPGLAVTAAAFGAFGPKPDMVVSGINAGINTGHSIIHSGTVGAALTGHTFKMKGLAISLAQSDPWRWETAAHYAPAAAQWLLALQNEEMDAARIAAWLEWTRANPANLAAFDRLGTAKNLLDHFTQCARQTREGVIQHLTGTEMGQPFGGGVEGGDGAVRPDRDYRRIEAALQRFGETQAAQEHQEEGSSDQPVAATKEPPVSLGMCHVFVSPPL